MRAHRYAGVGLLIVLLMATSLSPSVARPAAQDEPETGWPRETTSSDGTLWTVYQPQINSWAEQKRFDGWVAVAAEHPQRDDTVVGALHFTAATETNLEERIVVAHDLQIIEAKFPALDESRTRYMVNAAQSVVSEITREIALDRVLAYFDRIEAQPPELELSTEPPEIFVRTTPAVLLLLDGEPLMSPISEELDLTFAVNTNWDLFRQGEAGLYYLRNQDAWLAAENFRGLWHAAARLPDDFMNLPATDNWKDVRAAIPPSSVGATPQPEIVVSTEPAELISIDGEPTLTAIDGTQLSFVDNTISDLLFHSGDDNYYYLVAGRWFRATSLEGPWTFASRDLPDDFAQIPPEHERGEILYSVPGTPQAQEALILSQIPETAVVSREEATVDVSYAGDPDFEPIEGTDLEYAVNTAFDVIKVEDDEFYVNYEGVWFVGPAATGPWEVADAIPPEIYSIPATSPVHNTTYCEVEESNDTSVTFAISGGYFGMYPGYGSVYFGTGWYWPPYYGLGPYAYPYYYWRPYTYGVGAWYNPYSGRYGRSAVAYGPYGGVGRSAAYNPRTGTYSRGAAAWGPYSARMVGEAYNPRTGGYAQTRQSVSPYGRWGSTVATRGDDWARTYSARGESGTLRGFNTSGGESGFVARGDDTYVGKDGNVYRRDEGGWSKYDDGGWDSVDSPPRAGTEEQRAAAQERAAAGDRAGAADRATATDRAATGDRAGTLGAGTGTFDNRAGSADVMNRLDQDARARTQGNARAGQYQSYRSSGAGVRRGGGRRR